MDVRSGDWVNAAMQSLRMLVGNGGMVASVSNLVFQRVLGDSESAQDVIAFVEGMVTSRDSGPVNGADAPTLAAPRLETSATTGRPLDVRLFSWQLSYFSGKVRAYLRFKARGADALSFDDINASPAIIRDLLVPLTNTNVVPQLQLPDGSFCQVCLHM